MSNYEVMLEKCKREETKELIIQCLDKASIDNNERVKKDFIDTLEFIGVFIVCVVLFICIMDRIFK
jgi:hypothetical protein